MLPNLNLEHRYNQIITDGRTFARFIGVFESSEDYYYRVVTYGSKEERWSMVGRVIWLKDELTPASYDFLDTLITLNS